MAFLSATAQNWRGRCALVGRGAVAPPALRGRMLPPCCYRYPALYVFQPCTTSCGLLRRMAVGGALPRRLGRLSLAPPRPPPLGRACGGAPFGWLRVGRLRPRRAHWVSRLPRQGDKRLFIIAGDNDVYRWLGVCAARGGGLRRGAAWLVGVPPTGARPAGVLAGRTLILRAYFMLLSALLSPLLLHRSCAPLLSSPATLAPRAP